MYTIFKEAYQKNRMLLALTVILFVTIYPRIQVYFLPFTKELAKKEVYSELANKTKDYVKNTYGLNITAEDEEKYISKEYGKRLKDEKQEINKRIQEETKQKKSYWQDENNQTYLLEFDPYYLYCYTKNLLNKGTISDDIVDGKLYDRHSYAPEGKVIVPSLIIYTGFFCHKIFTLFNKNLPLVNTLFFVPLFLSVLVSVSIFFFVKRYFGVLVAFISTFVITLTPIFLSRSMSGWFDTDCFNLLFPFLITFLFYSALRQNSLKKGAGIISLASLSMGLYSLAWNGWWYTFYVILGGTILYILNTTELYLKYKEESVLIELKKFFVLTGLFIISSLILIAIIAWPTRILDLINAPMGVFRSVYAKQSFTTSLWPNTYLTVAELNPSDLRQIIYFAGDPFIFFIGLFGLFLLIKPRRKEDAGFQYLGFVFTVWLLTSVFASLKALRFSLLMAIPQDICFAVGVKFIIDLFYKNIDATSQNRKLLLKGAVYIFAFLFLIGIFQDRFFKVRGIRPTITDDYAKVLERIKKESPTDTIVNSWWDYGTWYIAIGERRVIFDGTTQHTPMAFWMARVLLTGDEAEAIGILRMINNSSNRAFEELKKVGLDDIDAFKLLREIIVIDKKEVEVLLRRKLPEDIALRVLGYAHKNPPSAYFIVDDHMIGIIGALTLLGNWSPEKAFIWQAVHTMNTTPALQTIEEKLNYDRNETTQLYKEALPLNNSDLKIWATKTRQFYSPLSNGTQEGRMVLFDNNVAVDLDNFNARIKTVVGADTWKRPRSLIYPTEDGGFKEITYKDAEVPFTVLLIPNEGGYKTIILDYELARSMFVRLFFLKGHGLKHFKYLFSEKGKELGNINVWEIDWEGKQENNIVPN